MVVETNHKKGGKGGGGKGRKKRKKRRGKEEGGGQRENYYLLSVMFMCYDTTYHHRSGIGQLHLVVLLHVTHSSDVPPSSPVHNDLPPLPGQLLASSKLLRCCTQYL
jgi:hypothetical protein